MEKLVYGANGERKPPRANFYQLEQFSLLKTRQRIPTPPIIHFYYLLHLVYTAAAVLKYNPTAIYSLLHLMQTAVLK